MSHKMEGGTQLKLGPRHRARAAPRRRSRRCRHGHGGAAQAARAIESAVDRAFAAGRKPCVCGGRDGTAAIAAAVLRVLDASVPA